MAFSLIDLLLALDPKKRPKIGEALTHPYWLEEPRACEKHEIPQVLGDWHEFESKLRRKEERRAQQTKQGLEGRRPSSSVEASSSKSASPLKRGDESATTDFPVTSIKEEPLDSMSSVVMATTSVKPTSSSLKSSKLDDSFEELLGEAKVPSRIDQFEKEAGTGSDAINMAVKRPRSSTVEAESKNMKRKRGRPSKSPNGRTITSRVRSKSPPESRSKEERKGRETSRSPRPRRRSDSQENPIFDSSRKRYGEESNDSFFKSYSRKSRDNSADRESVIEKNDKRPSQIDGDRRRRDSMDLDVTDPKSYARGDSSASKEKVTVEFPLELKNLDYPLAFRI
jgi:hypothetical protein